MNRDEAIEILTQHQLWRRGADMDMPNTPKELGTAIDLAIEALKQPTHCTASGYVCVRKNVKNQTQNDLCTTDDTLPPINEATGHDVE